MTDTLPQRLNEDEQHSLDRRKISEQSKRELAEYIHHGDTTQALDKLFRVLTGDMLADHEPYRKVGGDISTTYTLGENENLVVEVTLGTQTTTVYIDDTQTSTYVFLRVLDGTYDMTATAIEVREYDPDTLESTTTAVDSATVTMDNTYSVDTTETDFGAVLSGPTIEISDVTLEETQ